jgi:hypothetical protein
MRRAALLVALFVVTACGSSSSAANNTSPSPSAPASPSASPSVAASAAPSPVAALPCKMPATLRTNGTVNTLGWLTLPAGTTTDEPSLHIQKDGDVWDTDHAPQLYGNGGAAWSSAINSWVPVDPELLAADGIHYTYLGVDGKIHLANAQTLQESLVDNPFKLGPIAYTPAGVVLTQAGVPSNGLWLLDPATQSISAISAPTAQYFWMAAANGRAWGVDSSGALGAPPAKQLLTAQVLPNPQVINATNTATVAYTAPAGDSIHDVAPDIKGGVLILLAGSTPGLVYLPQGASATPYQVPPGINVAVAGPIFHADAHGIWLTGNSGVFLFNTTSGLQKVAGAVNPAFVPAGDCV